MASTVDSFVSFVSAALMSLLGLNYYAIVWAFVGALVALTQSDRMDRIRAVLYVLFSTFIGALLGTSAAEFLSISRRSSIAVMSLLGGIGWQGMVAILLKVAEGRIRSFLPPSSPPPPPPPAGGAV